MSAGGVEREAKFDVNSGFIMPSLAVDGLAEREMGVLDLDATYWDTEDLRLHRSGRALRRRVGRGWTLKRGSRTEGHDQVRDELDWPDTPRLPTGLSAELGGDVHPDDLLAVVRMHTRREIRILETADKQPVFEVADDAVEVVEADRVVASFREVEVETLDEALAPDLIGPVCERLESAGARSHTLSKYERALRAVGRLG